MLEHKPSAGYWRRAFRESTTHVEAVSLGLSMAMRLEELEARVIALGGDPEGLCLDTEAADRALDADPIGPQEAEVSCLSSA